MNSLGHAKLSATISSEQMKLITNRIQYMLRCFNSYRFSVFDVAVIGGGHAGCEAAFAAARLGARTILITQNKNTVGEMSCNPSIGGIGKAHLVREIDALGGLMARVADVSALSFKLLNINKGDSVQGVRAQIDRDLYKQNMQNIIFNTPSLQVREFNVEDFQLNPAQDSIISVRSSLNEIIEAKTFILTTGTFLRGVIHIGNKSYAAGRHLRNSNEVEPACLSIADTLKRLKFPIDRVTTGTPPRLDGRTIDYTKLEEDTKNWSKPFSFVHEFKGFDLKQFLPNWRTKTSSKTKQIVEKYRHLLPTFDSHQGLGNGPRYCPSLQKKYIRFTNTDQHMVFLEPEGLNTHVVYPTGLSSAFPEEIQKEIVHSISGLQSAIILHPSYSIEYDFIDPKHLNHSLRSSILLNLYLAGQINGTTGYEEAAAQGIIAGVNAALLSQTKSEYIISRSKSYIGVLIDDLITQGVTEPYRMFTSRSESRLTLSANNADMRLSPEAIKLGLLHPEQTQIFLQKQELMRKGIQSLENCKKSMTQWATLLPHFNIASRLPQEKSASNIISSYRFIRITDIENVTKIKVDERVHLPIENQLKYGLAIHSKEGSISSVSGEQLKRISLVQFPFERYKNSLTNEEYTILVRERPATLKDASMLRGIRPATVAQLYYMHRKLSKRKAKANDGESLLD